MVHEAKIMSFLPSSEWGRTPYEEVTGDTPDISEYLDFDFYDPVYFIQQTGDDETPRIGRWLGVSHRVGAAIVIGC